MAETIEKCFLIDDNDYSVFDSIIKILNNKNEIISLIALGVKKILSKNARNLQYGKMLEIEYFRSRNKDSLSKLKKVKIIDEEEVFSILKCNHVILLNKFLSKNLHRFSFEKYKRIIEYSDIYSEETMDIYVLWIIFNSLGIFINLEMCSECRSKKIKTISIYKHGYLCPECASKNNEYIHSTEFNKIFIKLKNEDLYSIEKFNEKESLKKFLLSYIKINSGIIL